MNYYIQYQYYRDKVVQDPNIQKHRMIEQYQNKFYDTIESPFPQLQKYTEDKEINNINTRKSEFIKQWILGL